MAKLAIKNIGQILSRKLEEPIFDGDCMVAIDGKITEWGDETRFGYRIDQSAHSAAAQHPAGHAPARGLMISS